MKARFVSMLLTGLALAVGLLIAVQISQSIRNTSSLGESSSETASEFDTNKATNPVIFSSVSEQSGRLRLVGTGPESSLLALQNHGKDIVSFSTDRDGEWSTEIDVKAEDTLELQIIAKSKDAVKVRSDETVYRIAQTKLGIEQSEPPLIMITAPGGPTNIVQSPFREQPRNGPLGIGAVDYDESGGVIFSGVSEIPGRIRIYANDVVIGEVPVQSNGRWFLIAAETMTLPKASYDVKIEHTSENGDVTDVTVPFKFLTSQSAYLDTSLPIFVEYTPYRWQVRRKLYGGGYQYTAVFAPIVSAGNSGE